MIPVNPENRSIGRYRYLQLFCVPGVQGERPHLRQVDSEAPENTAGSLLVKPPVAMETQEAERVADSSPVDPRTLDAHGHAQIDRRPARLLLPAVTAPLIPGAPQGHTQRRLPPGWGAGGCVPAHLPRGGLFRLREDNK